MVNLLHKQFSEYGANAREWLRKCVLMLPEIEKFGVWRRKGFGSIYEYAAKLAGMSRNTVDDGLRIMKKIEDIPELKAVVEKKGINAVRPVLTIVTKETAGFWAEKAEMMPKNVLEKYVKGFREQDLVDMGVRPSTDLNSQLFEIESTMSVIMDLNTEIACQLAKLRARSGWNTLMKEFLQIRRAKLEQEKPHAVRTESRHIPKGIERFVLNRSNNTCEFADCTKHYDILHHLQRFALDKVHDPDLIVALCELHERLFHQGLIDNEEMGPKYWKLRKEPDKNHPKYEIDLKVQKFRDPLQTCDR